jgi:DNA-directed RNA polymerase delta subunit
MPETTSFHLNTIIQRNENNFLANSLGEETVMMDINNGDYLGINSVGTDIWNLLNEPISVQDLIKKLLELYDVSEEECATEINSFLSRMNQQNMLIVVED